MPIVSEKQRRAMQAAAHGRSKLGIPRDVAKEFLAKDDLLANAAIPAALARKPALDEAGEVAGHAAGVLFVAPDGDVLLLRRAASEKNYGGHWGLPGGGVDGGETPEQGAVREAREEMGVDVDPADLKPLHRVRTPTGMAFHTFAHPVAEKFVPTLDAEHSGFCWASLDMLPQPLHPSVDSMLRERVGVAEDMTPEDWDGLRRGFVRWTLEEQAEPEHDDEDVATDSALALAMDRESVREKTRDGRLVVKKANITKANVCPYRGSEIPGWQKLGLDPDRVYNLLRDPEELRKAAPTLNGVQLLIKHVPVHAEDHRPNETVGSLGTDAEFDGTYLTNSLFVNAKDAIEAIESGKQRELSAGYHYTPDMTPGIFNGKRFDGIMRDLNFNHVALVSDGRAGPDVVVGDEALKEIEDMTKPTRYAALLMASTAARVAPLLAMDSKVTLPRDLFVGVTPKTFKDARPGILAGLRGVLDGKLRKGLALDATMQGLAKAIDAFEGLEEEIEAKDLDAVAEVAPQKVEAPDATVIDAEPLKAFLREKGLGEDDVLKACELMPKAAVVEDEDKDDEKKDDKDMVTKQAMDEAIKAATAGARKTEQAIRAALAEVKPWVGDLPATMAFDSAAGVLRHTLKMLGVEGHDTIHDDALRYVLRAQKQPGARSTETKADPMALDASALDKAIKLAPGLKNIQTVA